MMTLIVLGMSNDKRVYTYPKRVFDDVMLMHKITLDNIETRNACFISINETLQDHPDVTPYFSEERSNLKVIFFDDIEEDLPIMHKGKRVVIKAFTIEQAKELVDFIEKNKDKKFFHVHCAAGVSRSGAVATFINNYFELDYMQFRINNPHIFPNGLVLSLLNRIVRESQEND